MQCKITTEDLCNSLRSCTDPDSPLDPKVKARWVKALRSGKYKQGYSALCRVAEDGSESFCCLGVLANEELDDYWIFDGKFYEIDGSGAGLSDDILGNEIQGVLSRANDHGLPFHAIGDAIEECL